MIAASPSATFRDPAGSLRFEDDHVIRTVAPSSRAEVFDLLESPFCRNAQQRGDLIGADVDDSHESLQLIHPKVSIPTYPWEWAPAQWLAAAQLTLDLCNESLAEGWGLKDATPLNILFTGARPIFVDILSFERRDHRSSIWLAYGQYVRTFLLPLLMNRALRWPLALSLFRRDGYEPVECYDALGFAQRFSRDAFWPITLPTLLDRRKKADAPPQKLTSHVSDPDVALSVLRRTLGDLRRRTLRAAPREASSEWSGYTHTLTHYTAEQSTQKLEWVRHIFSLTEPGRVLDIGANTGEFSALAAESGSDVIALERDIASADRLFRMARQRNLSIQTIVADIARPTPAVGWQNSESTALLPRLHAQFDMVLMLAVIHHLLLMEQIPLPAILDLCHSLTRRHLIIEWVPVEDPMYQSLMRGRDNLYGSLTEADLLAAAAGRFNTVDRRPLDNGRVLFLFERIA